MPLTELQHHLKKKAPGRLLLKINENRSTMLSVRWEPDCTKVSLHKMFLQAPRNIMEELACYVQTRHSQISTNVRAFIEKNLQQIDLTHLLNTKKLSFQGSVYNLQNIYNELNQNYFNNQLDLKITWFGRPIRPRRHMVFGLYHDSLRLIKIHRLLDSPSFPDYVVSYVIYHEMVHHVCPSYFDKKGLHRVHSPEFKAREKQFAHYDLAQRWIKEHTDFLFH